MWYNAIKRDGVPCRAVVSYKTNSRKRRTALSLAVVFFYPCFISRAMKKAKITMRAMYSIGTTSDSRIRKRPCRCPSWLHTHYIICMTYRQGVFGSFYVFCVFLCVKRHCVIDIHPDSCYHKDAAEAGWLLLVVVFDWLPSPYAGSLYYLPLPNIEYLHTRTSGRVFFLPVLC